MEGKMEEININEITDDCSVRSIILALRSMFYTEIMPKCNQAEEFIYGYLSEFKSEILPYFKSDTINKYCFVTDNIIEKREAAKRALQLALRSKISSGENNGAIFWDAWDRVDSLGYENLFNSGIYNLCMLIISIDESLNMDEEIIIENATGEYEKCEKLIQCKMEGISMIHLGVSDFVITMDQMKGCFDGFKKYNVAPDMNFLLQALKRFQRCNMINMQQNSEMPKEGECFLSDILLLIGLYWIRQQCSIEKFMIALLFIATSPEYTDWMHDYAYTMINLLNEILYCGKIYKVYLQEGYYDPDLSVALKGSKDATTRISIIFSVCNDDIYILRIDLPHLGEEAFHINIEECHGETILSSGYPLDYLKGIKIKKKIGEEAFDKLFFIVNGKIWFRSQFDRILKHLGLSEENKEEIERIFHDQSHLAIAIKSDDQCDYHIEFTEEIKKYLRRFNMPENHFLCFGKEDINYAREIRKIRGLYELEEIIMGNMEHNPKVQCQNVLIWFCKCLKFECSKKASTVFDIWNIFKEVLEQ